jgi:3-methyladenine DNA glycosylase/8-oxoguanine DNA glycosylase
MKELLSFDSIGIKTASCVLLFCLGRDSFAVDTYVLLFSLFHASQLTSPALQTCLAHLAVPRLASYDWLRLPRLLLFR